ncbi:glycerophosphodiester phosphodiesterase family protein [Streptomyces chartreusis]|uniref:glycerophosphodiester phosphodiesterase family protein n=1 Tax=Streptomyces chartreusis TaxID=1969 RepID=UPI00365C1C95
MNYVDYIADPARNCAITAHRGIWRAAPENSLPAIEKAISDGYDVVEIDVRQSADGEYFLLHDDTLERMTGLNREPEELAWSELSRLKLRDRDGGELNQVTRERLPTLKEVFDLTRDRIFVHLDVKHREIIPGVIACAQLMGVDQQVDFWGNLRTSDDFLWIRETIHPHDLPFIAKTRLEATDAENQLDLVFKLNPFICEISFQRLDQVVELKDRFQEAGIALWVNTLDSVSSAGFTDTAALTDPEAVWGRLISAGISAIQTDEAEALKSFIEGRRT